MTSRPSILLVMCDQLNAWVLSCYGGPVPTPNLDRLAQEGVRFTDVICTMPLCSPSRASMITGMYPHSHGIVHNVNRRDYPAISCPPTEEGLKTEDLTTERLLSEAGYQTHHYGKWHLLDNDLPYYADMFGEHHEYEEEMAEIFAEVRQRPADEWMDWYNWALPTIVSSAVEEATTAPGPFLSEFALSDFITKMGRLDLPLETNFDVRVADQVVERLGKLTDDPFMITCSFNYPHDPNVVPSPYYEQFDPDQLELPANWGRPEALFEDSWSWQIPAELGEQAVREFLRIYYACVKLIDDQVGRVLRALEATGRAQDTVVIFTADHGDMTGGHGMIWKSNGSFYDEIVRVPLLIRYPARLHPGTSHLAASLVDLMPTLLDLAGYPVPEQGQGASLAPHLRGEQQAEDFRPYAFSERVVPNPEHTREVRSDAQGAFMVRGGGWKYCRYPSREEFLYDLQRDPGETVNLAAESACRERKTKLQGELEVWLERTAWTGGWL